MIDWKKTFDEVAARLLKAGTSEGAKLGWETRKRGYPQFAERKPIEEGEQHPDDSLEEASRYSDHAMDNLKKLEEDVRAASGGGWDERLALDSAVKAYTKNTYTKGVLGAVDHAVLSEGVQTHPKVKEARDRAVKEMNESYWAIRRSGIALTGYLSESHTKDKVLSMVQQFSRTVEALNWYRDAAQEAIDLRRKSEPHVFEHAPVPVAA